MRSNRSFPGTILEILIVALLLVISITNVYVAYRDKNEVYDFVKEINIVLLAGVLLDVVVKKSQKWFTIFCGICWIISYGILILRNVASTDHRAKPSTLGTAKSEAMMVVRFFSMEEAAVDHVAIIMLLFECAVVATVVLRYCLNLKFRRGISTPSVNEVEPNIHLVEEAACTRTNIERNQVLDAGLPIPFVFERVQIVPYLHTNHIQMGQLPSYEELESVNSFQPPPAYEEAANESS